MVSGPRPTGVDFVLWNRNAVRGSQCLGVLVLASVVLQASAQPAPSLPGQRAADLAALDRFVRDSYAFLPMKAQLSPDVFVDLTYPPAALAARVEGAVVVRVTTDASGRVIDAEALSGRRCSCPPCPTASSNGRCRAARGPESSFTASRSTTGGATTIAAACSGSKSRTSRSSPPAQKAARRGIVSPSRSVGLCLNGRTRSVSVHRVHRADHRCGGPGTVPRRERDGR